jgi:AcrR family transcriptional regulator
MEYRKGIMKTSLAENLRVLMTRKLFEKITIKQICDETGVIRATFYNYFDDKYDCLNWIVHMDLLVDENKERELSFEEYFQRIFTTVDQNRDFYRAAYQVIGQNSFEDMIKDNLTENVEQYLKRNRDPSFLPGYDTAFLARYYAESLNFVVRNYVYVDTDKSPKEMTRMVHDLMTHSFNNAKGEI